MVDRAEELNIPGETGDVGVAAVQTIAVASGKGGVGKTNVVANLAIAMQRAGKRVIVIDADLGLANVDTLLGLNPTASLRNVLRGECSIADTLVEGPAGMRLVPAASGFEELTQLSQEQRLQLLGQVDSLEGDCDVLLIDTGAGISQNVLFFATAAQETLVVVTPDPTSLTDAYALVKVLATRYAEREFTVLVNMARNDWEARKTFTQLTRVTERFLNVGLTYAGFVPHDAEVTEAVRRQQSVLDLAPGSAAASAFTTLAARMAAPREAVAPKGGLQFFFQRLLAGQAG